MVAPIAAKMGLGLLSPELPEPGCLLASVRVRSLDLSDIGDGSKLPTGEALTSAKVTSGSGGTDGFKAGAGRGTASELSPLETAVAFPALLAVPSALLTRIPVVWSPRQIGVARPTPVMSAVQIVYPGLRPGVVVYWLLKPCIQSYIEAGEMLMWAHCPAPPLSEFVDVLWLYEGYDVSHEKERLLPDGTLELVINLRENRIRVYDPHRPERYDTIPGCVVSGPRSEFKAIGAASGGAICAASFLRMDAPAVRIAGGGAGGIQPTALHPAIQQRGGTDAEAFQSGLPVPKHHPDGARTERGQLGSRGARLRLL